MHSLAPEPQLPNRPASNRPSHSAPKTKSKLLVVKPAPKRLDGDLKAEKIPTPVVPSPNLDEEMALDYEGMDLDMGFPCDMNDLLGESMM